MKLITILFLFVLPIITYSQTLFKGTVSDELGILSEANITIKNSEIGVVSDTKGYFEIQAKMGDVLLISYLGYKTKEVIVDAQEHDIKLEGNIALDEVVVVGYGTTRCTRLCCGYYSSIICPDFKSDIFTEKLYPNPSKSGVFQLNLLNDYKNIKVHVSNMSGGLVKIQEERMLQKNIEIDLSSYPSGIYIINIIADGKRLSPKKAIRG